MAYIVEQCHRKLLWGTINSFRWFPSFKTALLIEKKCKRIERKLICFQDTRDSEITKFEKATFSRT